MDALSLFVASSVLALWLSTLPFIHVQNMTDLGLVSVLPVATIIALGLLIGNFCITLWRVQEREVAHLIHLLLLICMLYGITTLVEEAPRFAVVYRHAGYTEFITRTGTVNPYLEAYFNWPGFFILSAFLTQIMHQHDILSIATWAPVFFNISYLGPLYMIFSTATREKRVIWLGLLFFYLANWIGQDYFSPQGLNFFLYLVIIAILLKWFMVTPVEQASGKGDLNNIQRLYRWIVAPRSFVAHCEGRQRIGLFFVLLLVFGFSVFSHPLTPFFILTSVTVLVIFRRCAPFWLPLLMVAMIGAWMFLMAQPFLVGHLSMITGNFGQVNHSISSNVTDRVGHGSPEHAFIATLRLLTTGVIWGLALLGGIRRYRQGYRDLPYILLAVAPFAIIIAQSYGGEVILRIYLFALPMMTFFAAALFGPAPQSKQPYWMTIAIVCTSLTLLGGFLFTRYGNERMDYMTRNEVAGVQRLYNIAPPHSLLIEGWYGVPWQFQGYELYSYRSLQNIVHRPLPRMITAYQANEVIQYIQARKYAGAYIIFTRSAKVSSNLLAGAPEGTLDRLKEVLLQSGRFILVYHNPDAEILKFI